ncbi:MAG: hypothetical protein NTZ72_09010 [Afipia sp.]|nr:hypothetical protein [Afipia sp.]
MTNLYFHWRRLVAISIALMIGQIVYKLSRDFLSLPYIHLLVDFHFGFIRRALVGAMMSLALTKIPQWMPFATGLTAIAIAFVLYLKLFQKTFGFSKGTAPLFVFLACSPFFFKNFILTVGYFDVIGCAFAIAMLLVPARSFWFVVLGATLSALLILIHNGQTLLFVPTILFIVGMRYFVAKPVSRGEIAGGLALLALTAAVAAVPVFYGDVNVPKEEFLRYLQTRSLSANKDWEQWISVWYDAPSVGMHYTWDVAPRQLYYIPVYVVLLALHAPLIKYFRNSIDVLTPLHRHFVLAGMTGITLAYVVVFVIVSDYSRWLSDWVVCMMLVLHLVKQLPSARTVPLIESDNWRNISLGFIVAILPRVGGVTPF